MPTLAAAAAGVVLLAACGGGAASPESAATEAAATTEEDQTASDDGATETGFEDVEPIELTFSDSLSEAGSAATMRNLWMERVTELTEGKVTFDFHGESTLHPITEGNTALRDGLTDITFITHGYFPDQLPIANWDNRVLRSNLVGLGYPLINVAGQPASLLHYAQGGPATEETASQGWVPLLTMGAGPSVLHCAEPFSTLDDLAGRQVRVADSTAQAEHEALGMTGVFLSPVEQYEALQRGVIDCAVNAVASVLSGSLLEVAPYSTFTANAPSVGSYYAISAEVWDSLPASVQSAMQQARVEGMVLYMQLTLDQYQEYAEAVEQSDGEMVDSTQFDEVIREWRSTQPEVVAVAPEGVSDPEETVQAHQAIVDDLVAFVEDRFGISAGPPESFDEAMERFSAGRDIVDDWEAYQQYLDEYLASLTSD